MHLGLNWTDGPTDRLTDGPTDKWLIESRSTQLKIVETLSVLVCNPIEK